MSYNYELALVFSAKTVEDKQKKLVDEVKKTIAASGGKAEEEKSLGKKTLAYTIKRENAGYYYILKFTLAGREVVVLNNKLRLNEEILRYLIVRK